MSSAIIAASITSVPEPHIGSTKSPVSAIAGQPLRKSTAAARVSFSGAATPRARYARRCKLSPERSRLSVARSRSRRTSSCTSGRSSSTDGRCPVRSRSWSTIASLVFSAPKCVCLMPADEPPNSMASVPLAATCCAQSIDETPSYSACGVAAGKFASGMRMRLAVRDHRHARYAVSSVPSNSTPSLSSRVCVAPQVRSSAAVRSATPGGQEAKKGI